MSKLTQLEFNFTREPRCEKRHRRDTPLAVRVVAQRAGVSIDFATAFCRANGIGGKEVI